MEKGDDPYQILGLVSTASDERIQKAYRYLIQQCHPDCAPNSGSVQFTKVSAAYELLSNQEMRQAYDSLQQAIPQSSSSSGLTKKRGFEPKKLAQVSFQSPHVVFSQDFEEQFGYPYPGARYDWKTYQSDAPTHHKHAHKKHASSSSSSKPHSHRGGLVESASGTRNSAPRPGMRRGNSVNGISSMLNGTKKSSLRDNLNNSTSSFRISSSNEPEKAGNKRGLMGKMFRATSFRHPKSKKKNMLLLNDDEEEEEPRVMDTSPLSPLAKTKKRSTSSVRQRDSDSNRSASSTSNKENKRKGMVRSNSSGRDLSASAGAKPETTKTDPSNTVKPTVKVTRKQVKHKDGSIETITTRRITHPDGTVETIRNTDQAARRPSWLASSSTNEKLSNHKQSHTKVAHKKDTCKAPPSTEPTAKKEDLSGSQELSYEELKAQVKEEIREELNLSREDLKAEIRREMEASGQLSFAGSLDSGEDGGPELDGEEGPVVTKRKKKASSSSSNKHKSRESRQEPGLDPIEEKKKSKKKKDKTEDFNSSFGSNDMSLDSSTGKRRRRKKPVEALQ